MKTSAHEDIHQDLIKSVGLERYIEMTLTESRDGKFSSHDDNLRMSITSIVTFAVTKALEEAQTKIQSAGRPEESDIDRLEAVWAIQSLSNNVNKLVERL